MSDLENTPQFDEIRAFLATEPDAALESVAAAPPERWVDAFTQDAKGRRCLIGHLRSRLSRLQAGAEFCIALDFDWLCLNYGTLITATACRALARTELARRRGEKP